MDGRSDILTVRQGLADDELGDILPYDETECLTSAVAKRDYLALSIDEDDGSGEGTALALSTLVKLAGSKTIAAKLGMNPQQLDQEMSNNADLPFATVLRIIRALGFDLSVVATKSEG